MNSKTYSPKNLKFVSVLIFILTLSVVILLYLLSLKNFTPIDSQGTYIWLNIFAVIFLSYASLSSFSSLISYFILLVVLKREDSRKLKVLCLRWGILFSLGIFFVLLLHFFHILNLTWGLGILTVVILASFVI